MYAEEIKDIKKYEKLIPKKLKKIENLYVYYSNYKEKTPKNNKDDKLFFEEFCKAISDDKRINFLPKVKEKLKHASSSLCCKCLKLTTYISLNNEIVNRGQAAHIYPASFYGPRAYFLKRIDEDFISSFENGLWLCLDCHNEIDRAPEEYTVEKLLNIRKESYEFVRKLAKDDTKIKQVLIEKRNKENELNEVYLKVEKMKERAKKGLEEDELINKIESILVDFPEDFILKSKNGKKELLFDNLINPDRVVENDNGISLSIPKGFENTISKMDELQYNKKYKHHSEILKSLKKHKCFCFLHSKNEESYTNKNIIIGIEKIIKNNRNKEIEIKLKEVGSIKFKLNNQSKIESIKEYSLNRIFEFFIDTKFEKDYKIFICYERSYHILEIKNDFEKLLELEYNK